MAGAMTRKELLDLPTVVPLAVAGRALGIGRNSAQRLARAGKFPCRVLQVGSTYKVPTVGEGGLLDVLGVRPEGGQAAVTPPSAA